MVLENGRVQSILATLEGTFGICILDEHGIFQYVNNYFSEITHYQRLQLLQASYKAMDFKVVPSSSSYFETALAGEVWKGEAILHTPDDEEKWFYLILMPVKDEYGKVQQVVMLANDITDYKMMEKKVDESLYGLKNVREALDEASIVAITDKDGYIEHVNDKFCEISQYERRQLVGKTHRIINSRHHPRSFFTEMWDTILSGQVWRGEVKNRAKDGSFYWMNTTIVPVFDQEGNIDQFISIRTDITKRIEAEAELARVMEDDFKKVVQNLQNWVFRVARKNDLVEILLSEGKFAEELGITTDVVRGKTICQVLDESNAIKMKEELQQAFNGERVHTEITLNDMYIDMMLTPVIENGEVVEVVGSISDITARKKAEEKVRYLANYDVLTDLVNRNHFTKLLEDAIENAKKRQHKIAVLFIDLDRFTIINDSLGHHTGDRILQKIATNLKAAVDKRGVVARFGGDEFAIFLSNKDPFEVSSIVENMMKAFSNPLALGNLELYVTPGIGISMYPTDATDAASLLKNANAAMSLVKEQGGNNFQFYTKELQESLLTKLELEIDLRKALENDELELYYQTKVDIEKNRITGAEALIRWNHPLHGLIAPNEFIPIAEESGLIIDIGEWVLRTACQKARKWHDNGHDDLTIAVNISMRQFLQKNIHIVIENVLKETGIPPASLELEITESMTLDAEYTIKTLNKIKSLGVVVSIDDFGTGYSSLSYLSKFPVDKLKIDQSFVRDLNDTNKSIIKAIINIADSLNIDVIAEGVEEAVHVDFLSSENCKEVQGYYFSRPVPQAQINQILEANKVIC